MRVEQQKGFAYSAMLHLLIMFLFIFGLPTFMRHDVLPQPAIFSVEILPSSEITNVKTADTKLAEEEKTKPIFEEKPPLPKPEEPTSEPVSDSVPEPLPEPTVIPEKKQEEKPKKEEKKPEPKPKKDKEKPKDKPQKKAREKDLEEILKNLREQSEKEKDDNKNKEAKIAEESTTRAKSKDAVYDASLPMSLNELDLIRSQIAKCWNVPAGAKNAHSLRITLHVQLAEDGSLINVELADESKNDYNSDNFFRAASDSAMRAVRQCSPLKNLPPEKYSAWRDMLMIFDPKEMLF